MTEDLLRLSDYSSATLALQGRSLIALQIRGMAIHRVLTFELAHARSILLELGGIGNAHSNN